MDKKIINNAISAYLWLWALLLLPSKKENINHPFVKKHAKTWVFIHFLMFINYLIFITYSLFWTIIIFDSYWLNHIIASIIFIWLFGWLLYGINKAKSWDDFSIWDMAQMSKTQKVIEIKNSNLNEQWIFTIILSLIPFIWFSIRWKFKNYKSPILENNIKLNLIFCLIISFLYIIWDYNIVLLLILWYSIFVWFYSILLIAKQNVINIKLDKIPTFEDFYIQILSFIKYLLNYISSKEFVSIKIIIENTKKSLDEKNKNDENILNNFNTNKIANFIAYIPFLNIVSLIDFNSKNRFHIINGLTLTIISIILYYTSNNNYQILLFFPIFFGIWYLRFNYYKIPFLFDIYEMFEFVFDKIFRFKNKIIETKNSVQEVTFTNSDI